MPGHRYKLLLVEPEGVLQGTLTALFREQGYQVLTADSQKQAAMMFTSHMPDMVILETLLPDGDGLELIRQVREVGGVPVMVLSRRNAQQDIVCALDLGANDYLTKPFNILELKARIKALLRRAGQRNISVAQELTIGSISLDLAARNAFRNGEPVELTAKEFDVVEFLMRNPNRVYSRENLLKLVWGEDYPGDVRTVDVHIRRLREKIEENPSDPHYVQTKWGVGYFYKR